MKKTIHLLAISLIMFTGIITTSNTYAVATLGQAIQQCKGIITSCPASGIDDISCGNGYFIARGAYDINSGAGGRISVQANGLDSIGIFNLLGKNFVNHHAVNAPACQNSPNAKDDNNNDSTASNTDKNISPYDTDSGAKPMPSPF